MKIAGKKIPKGYVLLFFSFAAISLCLLLIASSVRTGKQNRLSQYTLYSGNQTTFSVMGEHGAEEWGQVLPQVAANHNHFALYFSLDDSSMIARGVCTQWKDRDVPMIWGNYFDFSTSWTDDPKAVVGRDGTDNIVERDGKKYYTFEDTEFEVIGIMGTKNDSRINKMLLMDFKSALRIKGTNSDYVLDSRKDELIDISKEIYEEMPSSAEVYITLTDEEPPSLREIFLSPDVILDTMYVMILVSFSLSTILVTLIWLRLRRQLFHIWKLCGYERRLMLLEVSERFYMITMAGFVTGLLMMLLMNMLLPEISLVFGDVLRAFAVTVGLGTIILFICYFIERSGLGNPMKIVRH